MSKFGNANYDKGSKFKKKVYFKIVDGDNVFRILPPFGDLVEQGIWSRFYKVHFGYKNMEGKLRTFVSPEVKSNKTKMIEVPDAALDRLNQLKTALEKARMEMAGPLTAQLNALVGRDGVYNVDGKHYVNAMDLNGAVGLLKVGHKVKLDLDEEIRKLRAEGVDPLSINNGRFFNFVRTRGATDRDTLTKVSVYKERIDVPGVGKVERELVSNLTPELLSRCEMNASDLDKIFSFVTADEVKQIVDESDLKTGKSPACDRIFDQRWKAEREAKKTVTQVTQTSSAPVLETPDEPGDDYTPPPAVVVAPVAAKPAEVATPKASAPVAAAVVVKPTQSQALEEMSDSDFFASIGVTA